MPAASPNKILYSAFCLLPENPRETRKGNQRMMKGLLTVRRLSLQPLVLHVVPPLLSRFLFWSLEICIRRASEKAEGSADTLISGPVKRCRKRTQDDLCNPIAVVTIRVAK